MKDLLLLKENDIFEFISSFVLSKRLSYTYRIAKKYGYFTAKYFENLFRISEFILKIHG
jgi:hypothetical protein